MKILWLSHFIPYPSRGGASQRSYNLLRQAAMRHDVTFVAFNRPLQSGAQLQESRAALESFCRQVVFLDLPFPWRGFRWWMRLALLPMSRWSVSAQSYVSNQTMRQWEQLIERVSPDLVHVDSGDLSPFLRAAEPYPLVLNHHNCESVMAFRRASLDPNPLKRTIIRAEAKRLQRMEVDCAHRVRLNFTVSREDASSLSSINPEAEIAVIDNGTDTGYFHPQPALEQEEVIVFASSLRWYPNQSALLHFDREIWPQIRRRRPSARFLVAGQAPPRFIEQWARSAQNVDFVPNPADIRPYIARGAVYVCPIIDGGGSRLKLLDAMAMGKAIVSTPVGAEGLRYTEGKEMLIARTASEFAFHVVELMEDRARRRGMGAAARQRALSDYSWDVIGRAQDSAYTRLVSSLRSAPVRTVAAL